jgi:hypothetical protein
MKRLLLGSLVSCMLVGQALCQFDSIDSMRATYGYVKNSLAPQGRYTFDQGVTCAAVQAGITGGLCAGVASGIIKLLKVVKPVSRLNVFCAGAAFASVASIYTGMTMGETADTIAKAYREQLEEPSLKSEDSLLHRISGYEGQRDYSYGKAKAGTGIFAASLALPLLRVARSLLLKGR